MKTLITTLSSLLALVTPMAVAAETETSVPAAQPPVMAVMLASLGTPTTNATAQPQLTLVNLMPTANIAGESVTLGDLGNLPADHPLNGLVIAPAPLPGLRLCLSRDQIELRLLRLGYRSGDVRLTGAGSVVVSRTGQMLRPDLVQAAVTKLIGLPVTVERLPQFGALPLGALDYRLRSDLPNPLPDQFSLTLDVLVAGQVVARPTVSLKLALPAAPVAAVDQTVSVTRPTPTPATGTRPAAPGAPTAPTAPAWQVKRGDRVAVTAVSGAVRIVLSGEARGQGTLGDTIAFEVVLGGQKRTVSARIVAPDRAVMEV
ncbi:MAG: flagella basal body P-ring formation protein FlgA [Armatimonadetes bacterium]|nr:flagella basal body P-ring formation protein FlgA [Armatimonadota bacterium]